MLLAVLANHLGGVWECSHRKMLEFIHTKIASGGGFNRKHCLSEFLEVGGDVAKAVQCTVTSEDLHSTMGAYV